jgi:hypothetical protein
MKFFDILGKVVIPSIIFIYDADVTVSRHINF